MKDREQERGSFLVKIQFRQRESWQGQVTWVEEKRTVSFRSALELIRLLDEAGNGKGRSWDDVYTGSALGEGGRDSQEA